MKTLVFLGDNYPLTAGEFFVDDEMKVIASAFDNILVFTSAKPSSVVLNRYIPNNVEVVNIDRNDLLIRKYTSLLRVFSATCKEECRFIRYKVPFLYRWKAFKVMYIDMHRAYRVKQYILAQLAQRHIAVNECVFYSYWHDYKALALAMLRQEYTNTTCIARAHRWDIYADTHNIPYLPFKKYIINHLTQTIAISANGKQYMQQYTDNEFNDKIIVSKLGKFNTRIPLMEKHNADVTICSCSTMTPVKRLDKIIEVLSLLHVKNIKWIHFGDGILHQKVEQYAKECLHNITFELKGIVPNNEILDFYAQNYVDVFINLSDSEGIPVSIMEALSAGIPVLATMVGGTAEAVNKENGLPVEIHTDVAEIAKILEDYLNSDKESQIQKRQHAYSYWQQNYEAGNNYKQFLQEILNV